MSTRRAGRSKQADATSPSDMKLGLGNLPKLRFSKRLLRASNRRYVAAPAIWLFLIASLVALTFASSASAAATTVPLATADSFGILAGSGITNTGATTLNGDIGTFPNTSISGAGTLTVTGTNHGGDLVTQQAKTDLTTAYNNAAGQTPPSSISADLGGQTLLPGIYNGASSIGLTGTLTLDGGGDPDAVFIFQAGSTLTTASASSVSLINGAQACNVFWQVGSSATLGTGSTFRGTIMALTSISVTTGVTVEGRVLARNGAVTLDTDTITRPICAAPTTTTSTSTTTSTTTPIPTPTTAPTTTTSPAPTPTTAPTSTTSPVPTPATTTPSASPTPLLSPTPGTTTPGSPIGTTPGTGTVPGSGTPGVSPTPVPSATPSATKTPLVGSPGVTG